MNHSHKDSQILSTENIDEAPNKNIDSISILKKSFCLSPKVITEEIEEGNANNTKTKENHRGNKRTLK